MRNIARPNNSDAVRIAQKLVDLRDRVSVMVCVEGATPGGDVTLSTTVNEVVSESKTVKCTGTGVTVVGAKAGGFPLGMIVGVPEELGL